MLTLEVLTVEETTKGALAQSLFRIVWQVLSFVGKCDQYGGAEYRRVFREWIDAGYPLPVAEFIVRRANASAEVTP